MDCNGRGKDHGIIPVGAASPNSTPTVALHSYARTFQSGVMAEPQASWGSPAAKVQDGDGFTKPEAGQAAAHQELSYSPGVRPPPVDIPTMPFLNCVLCVLCILMSFLTPLGPPSCLSQVRGHCLSFTKMSRAETISGPGEGQASRGYQAYTIA